MIPSQIGTFPLEHLSSFEFALQFQYLNVTARTYLLLTMALLNYGIVILLNTYADSICMHFKYHLIQMNRQKQFAECVP